MSTQIITFNNDFLKPAFTHDADEMTLAVKLKESTTFPQGCLVAQIEGTVDGLYAPYSNADEDVDIPVGLMKRGCITDSNGKITFGDASSGNEHLGKSLTAEIYVGGYFRTADIPQTGAGALDANAIGAAKQFGKIIKGDLADGILKLL